MDKICLLDMNSYLSIDESTIKNLDLVYNFATNSTKNGSLL
ncbi:MAG: hypothetical protein P1U46_02995 [Patescibacteria group bacterium]|nr:hypothetical protein [Patescibacteria group bacterium]